MLSYRPKFAQQRSTRPKNYKSWHSPCRAHSGLVSSARLQCFHCGGKIRFRFPRPAFRPLRSNTRRSGHCLHVADLLLLLPNSKAELPNNRYRRWRAGQKNRRRHTIDSICSGKSPATCMCAARGNNIYRAKGDTSLLRACWLYQSVFQVLFKSVEQGFQHIAMIQAQITHIHYWWDEYFTMLTFKLKDNRYFTQTLL